MAAKTTTCDTHIPHQSPSLSSSYSISNPASWHCAWKQAEEIQVFRALTSTRELGSWLLPWLTMNEPGRPLHHHYLSVFHIDRKQIYNQKSYAYFGTKKTLLTFMQSFFYCNRHFPLIFGNSLCKTKCQSNWTLICLSLK